TWQDGGTTPAPHHDFTLSCFTDGRALAASGGGETPHTFGPGVADLFQLSANGTACSAATTCASGFCVDGVCCNTSCPNACDRCDDAGIAGTCAPAPAGTVAPACSGYLCTGATLTCPT